jgi:hypothetical protein
MRQVVRRGIVAVGLILALAPLSAYADQLSNQANQDAIDANKAQKAWLQNMNPVQQGVELGQLEIANARAIAKLVPLDGHAQTEIPNSMQQYTQFCDMVILKVANQMSNATEMAAMRPSDTHAQAELANAVTVSKSLWSIIGDSYPGNPWANPTQPPGAATISDDATLEAVAATDDEAVASEASLTADDTALVADDAGVVADDDSLVAETALSDN